MQNMNESLKTLDSESIIQMINSKIKSGEEFHLSSFIFNLKKDVQLEVLANIDKLEINRKGKNQILANLKNDIKEKLKQNIDEKYLPILNLEDENILFLKFNPNIDFQNYIGLDERIFVDPILNNIDKEQIQKLHEVCPNIRIQNGELNFAGVTTVSYEEYEQAEEWVLEVIDKIEPNWSDIEKVAFIDSKVGQRISYSPNFGTEDFEVIDSRNLWKIVNSRSGVCNGISQLEKYILGKVGIKSKLVSGKGHSYLMIEDIEIPKEDGTIEKGNTLLDGTWNLASNLYGFYPQYFAKSYEEIRKLDIAENSDRCSHENSNLENCTIEIEEVVLRNIYKKLGKIGKDGKFIGMEMVNEIVSKQENLSEIQMVEEIYSQMKQFNPNFMNTQNSNMICINNLLRFQNVVNTNECVISRMHTKQNKDAPSFYTYLNTKKSGEVFFIPDEQKGFKKMTKEEFEQNYEIYEEDLKDGKALWQQKAEELEKNRNVVEKEEQWK